jgi:hypothetical protein
MPLVLAERLVGGAYDFAGIEHCHGFFVVVTRAVKSAGYH